jgi:uncharacterized membrane protein
MKTDPNAVFDYRALRLLMGLVAFSLPFATSVISTTQLASISASYYTEAHDVFICLLCIISTLLWAYNGHSTREKLASKIASIATLVVVIFPTSCVGCAADTKSIIHYAGAVVIFGILIYFCLGPFREGAKDHRGKKGRRAVIYLVCGWVMLLCMVVAVFSQLIGSLNSTQASTVVYWTETISLLAFGVAWIVAGKAIPVLTEEEERLKLSLKQADEKEFSLSTATSD